MYTVRASDGADLTRVTNFGQTPGDFSPEGTRISFVANDSNGDLRLYVANVNGGTPPPLTPDGLALVDDYGGTWSPIGNQILFVARPTPNSRRAIWVVNADGSELRQLSIPDCGGLIGAPASRSIGCDAPSWPPDGTKIAFSRLSAKTHVKNIYTVNSDGTDLFQVTRTGFQDFAPRLGDTPSRALAIRSVALRNTAKRTSSPGLPSRWDQEPYKSILSRGNGPSGGASQTKSGSAPQPRG